MQSAAQLEQQSRPRAGGEFAATHPLLRPSSGRAGSRLFGLRPSLSAKSWSVVLHSGSGPSCGHGPKLKMRTRPIHGEHRLTIHFPSEAVAPADHLFGWRSDYEHRPPSPAGPDRTPTGRGNEVVELIPGDIDRAGRRRGQWLEGLGLAAGTGPRAKSASTANAR